MKKYQIIIWLAALGVGALLGCLDLSWLNSTMNFIATVFTRLFRLLAVPTIVLAVITTLASLGSSRTMKRMFGTAVSYTLMTTIAASLVGLGLYLLIAPGNVPRADMAAQAATAASEMPDVKNFSYADHFLSVIPDNMVRPLLEGNVLALLLICFATGIAISRMPESEPKRIVMLGLNGVQEILFTLIRWLIAVLPIGIVAFAAQLTADMSSGTMIDSLGRYVVVILAGNCLQFIVVLPLFLLARGINPIKALKAMSPAVLMALFTKSSAATLPVTIDNAETRLNINPKVARFVLPICTTVNVNGCAAFILVTSLFVMQNNGMTFSWPMMALWVAISVLSAVGNAGVPMGCYFLTLSLMAGMGMDISLMGVILPIYTIIDMVESAENVWSDSCACAITDRSMAQYTDK